MTILEAIKARHSVRHFKDTPIPKAAAEALENVIGDCCRESGLNIQLVQNDPACFDTLLNHYGRFRNAVNYIAIVGSSSDPDLDERAGYYGERIVLEAQMLGLNTCWVAGTYSKGKCAADIRSGEKIVCVIAVGCGEDQGKPHKSKPLHKLCGVRKADMPVWFKNGMLAATLAPTALNQQKFFIDLRDGEAVITAPKAPMAMIDLGIIRYNFEAASGHSCTAKSDAKSGLLSRFKKYKINFDGCKAGFRDPAECFRVGEAVRLCFDMIATDTNYTFLVDGEPFSPRYEDHCYVLEFAMPDHDVTIKVNSRNVMLREFPPAETE